MQMRARLIQSLPRVTHTRDAFAAMNCLAGAHRDVAEMPVETVIGRSIPHMLDNNIASVVRVTSDVIGVHYFTVRDRAHCIESLPSPIAMQRFDIDAFVKSRVNQPGPSLDGVAHETIATAFPWPRFLAPKLAFDILVEFRAATPK